MIAINSGREGERCASYTFTAAGAYPVTLTVTDQCGNAATANTIDGSSINETARGRRRAPPGLRVPLKLR